MNAEWLYNTTTGTIHEKRLATEKCLLPLARKDDDNLREITTKEVEDLIREVGERLCGHCFGTNET